MLCFNNDVTILHLWSNCALFKMNLTIQQASPRSKSVLSNTDFNYNYTNYAKKKKQKKN